MLMFFSILWILDLETSWGASKQIKSSLLVSFKNLKIWASSSAHVLPQTNTILFLIISSIFEMRLSNESWIIDLSTFVEPLFITLLIPFFSKIFSEL